MNPAMLLTLKKKWEEFSTRHPKFVSFIGALKGRGVQEGSIIDITVTMPDGQQFQSNLKLTAEDIEMIRSLM
ncbi:MAG: hypothetical protein J6Z07_02695 [Lachnospiraceae bacterium]|jgi:hypothetical protein|nr:hypothetical protein [Lachnospiraceae bacterium]MBP5275690.1 hypothetical protein [Lachnospiraceae bacterium]MBQ4275259.1 hypothetical protein [Lachnospiraceae bacterium]